MRDIGVIELDSSLDELDRDEGGGYLVRDGSVKTKMKLTCIPDLLGQLQICLTMT